MVNAGGFLTRPSSRDVSLSDDNDDLELDLENLFTNLDDETGIIVLISGSIDGNPSWAYVSVYPSKYEEFLEKQDGDEEYDLTEYGEVLKWGEGDVPSPAEVREMVEEYGITPDFEDQVAALQQELEKDLKN